MKNLKCEKGFATFFLVALMPLLLSALAAIYLYFSYTTPMIETRNYCRSELLRAQSSAKDQIQQLFALNEEARDLKIALKLKQIELAAATAQGNGALAAEISAEILQIKKAQEVLDGVQKAIITKGNAELFFNQQKTHFGISRILFKYQQNLSRFLTLSSNTDWSDAPTLAVEPLSHEIAPEYGPKNDFTDQQTMALKWHISFTVPHSSLFHAWTKQSARFDEECGASIEKRKNQWSVVLTKGKFF